MKPGTLPQEVDIRALAARGAEVAGSITEEDLPRLLGSDVSLCEPADVLFKFSRDDEGRYTAEITLLGVLQLKCQRCLCEMHHPVNVNSLMACVWNDDEASVMPQNYEPLLVGEMADLRSIAEEEVLLSVPVSATHDFDCRSEAQLAALDLKEAGSNSPQKPRDNAFSILAHIKL